MIRQKGATDEWDGRGREFSAGERGGHALTRGR